MRKKKKKLLANFRIMALAHGPIKTKVKGTKLGKKGYNRKNKDWKNADTE